MERYEEALEMATRLHAGQVRKATTTPYITHPMSVAKIVKSFGGTEEEEVAALLHDTVEDCGGPPVLEEIRRRFGESIAGVVEGCTDGAPLPGEPKSPWKARKVAYLEHLKTASPSTLLVSAADKLHNARCIIADWHEIGDEVWERFAAPKAEVVWYYDSVREILAHSSDERVKRLFPWYAVVVATMRTAAGLG